MGPDPDTLFSSPPGRTLHLRAVVDLFQHFLHLLFRDPIVLGLRHGQQGLDRHPGCHTEHGIA